MRGCKTKAVLYPFYLAPNYRYSYKGWYHEIAAYVDVTLTFEEWNAETRHAIRLEGANQPANVELGWRVFCCPMTRKETSHMVPTTEERLRMLAVKPGI